jgi:hypothetical protein
MGMRQVLEALLSALRPFLVLCSAVLLFIIVSNRELLEGLIHLLQAIPPIVWMPIAIGMSSRHREDDRSAAREQDVEEPRQSNGSSPQG